MIYEFYKFDGMTETFETPIEAAESFKKAVKSNLNRYIALGVTRIDDKGIKLPASVDLVVFKGEKIQVSNDIEKSDLKNDSLISINTMNIYKDALGL